MHHDRMYRTLWVERKTGRYVRKIIERKIADLPDHPVLIEVHYSSLNYKDALSCSGKRGVTNHFPHQPGIDAAGLVVKSAKKSFKEGDKVIVTGYDLGQNTAGGFGQYIRVPCEWIVPLPHGLSLEEAMIFGTAGFTAGQALLHLSQLPKDKKILVTGATGGVSCLGLSILSKLGYATLAVSGKAAKWDWLRELGATEILSRDAFLAGGKKPLLKAKWQGALEACGGKYLETAIKSSTMRGVVASYGLVASENMALTVYPFILRGVSLIGINSAQCPYAERLQIWEKLAGVWKPEALHKIKKVVGLEALNEAVDDILTGKICGRIVLKHTHARLR